MSTSLRIAPLLAAVVLSMGAFAQAGTDAPAPAAMAAASAPSMTPAAALESALGDGKLEEHELGAVEAALADAAAKEPKDARWQLGLCRVAMRKGDWTAAKKHGKQAAKLDPKNAEAQYSYGAAIFSGMAQASMFEKMSSAGDGKDALLEAVKLDPNHVGARMGLAQFYLNAPGIAGGSLKKAREQGEALVKIKGGAVNGHVVLASAAAQDEKWADMEASYARALEACATDAERYGVLASHAGALLNTKKDYIAARPIVEKMLPLAPPNDTSAEFMLARSKHLAGDYAGAVAHYDKVLAARPTALNSRFYAAQCREAMGETQPALVHYEEFVRQFPDEERASDAKKAIKRLKKKAKA